MFNAVLIFIISLVAIWIFVFIRNEWTYKQQIKIDKAIYRYNLDLIDHGIPMEQWMDYNDMESYGKTFMRFWDWGCKRILPPEKFEVIRPYINEKETDDAE